MSQTRLQSTSFKGPRVFEVLSETTLKVCFTWTTPPCLFFLFWPFDFWTSIFPSPQPLAYFFHTYCFSFHQARPSLLSTHHVIRRAQESEYNRNNGESLCGRDSHVVVMAVSSKMGRLPNDLEEYSTEELETINGLTFPEMKTVLHRIG